MRRRLALGVVAALLSAVPVAAARADARPLVPADAPPVLCPLGGPAIKGLRTTDKVITFTFDDGPSPLLAPTVMDIFEGRGLRATFFLVTHEVQRNAALVQSMVARGFEVGNHSWSHSYTSSRNVTEMAKSQQVIESVTGVRPIYYRVPGLSWTRRVLAAAGANGLCPLDTSTNIRDWATPRAPAKELCRRFARDLKPGVIVLLHLGGGSHRSTVAALPCMLDLAAARGYQVLPMRDFLARAGGDPKLLVLRALPKK